MIYSSIDVSLRGLDLAISGAIPDRDDWIEPIQDRAILEFVSILSGLVIKYGGRIIHGAHPTFTPVILQQTHLQPAGADEKAVVIFMSELWSHDLSPSERARLEASADLKIVPQPLLGDRGNPDVRNVALTSMRKEMLKHTNALVAVGGKLHRKDGFVPGVVEELHLAQKRGMACFLVGGFGGMASELASEVNARNFKNLLAEEYNELLLSSDDVAATINTIFSHLAHTPEIFGRKLHDFPADQ
jgi:hypothetical protein